MSPSSELRLPTWLKILPFVLVTLVGIALRFSNLESLPYGLDSDQAKVLSWGASALDTHEFKIFTNEETQFETLSAYAFAAADRAFGVDGFPGLGARMLSFALSLADLFLLGLLLRGLGPLRMWQGVSLLATCPWAIYYAHIFGPCVGVSTLLLLEFNFASRTLRLVTAFFGIWWYSLYRLVLGYRLIMSLWRRNFRDVWWQLVPVAVFGLLILGVQGSGDGAPPRGLYNLPLSFTAVFIRVESWFSLWFWKPAAVLVAPIPEFIVDPVSMGFARLVADGPALGLGLVPLLILALTQLPRFWREAQAEDKNRLGLFGLIVLALFISPTPSHALMILPLIPYLILQTLAPIVGRKEILSMIFGLAIFVAGVAGGVQSLGLLNTWAQRGSVEEVFPDRLRLLFETDLLEDPEIPRSYFVNQNYHTARYWSEILTRRGFTIDAYPALEPKAALDILSVRFREGPQQIVYFDIQDIDYPWKTASGYVEAHTRLQQLEIKILEGFDVVERKDLYVLGRPVARRYVIRRF